GGGGFDVTLSYTYAEELSNATFSVSVTDNLSRSEERRVGINVADAALTGSGFLPPTATEGAAFSDVVVFHFTDADPAGTVADYLATVNTGDATLTSAANPSKLKIVGNGGGGFDVTLSYTYAEELSNATFSVSVTDNLS